MTDWPNEKESADISVIMSQKKFWRVKKKLFTYGILIVHCLLYVCHQQVLYVPICVSPITTVCAVHTWWEEKREGPKEIFLLP